MTARTLIATICLASGLSAQTPPDLTGNWLITGVDKSQSASIYIVQNGSNLSGQFIAPAGSYFPFNAPNPGGASGPFTAPFTGTVSTTSGSSAFGLYIYVQSPQGIVTFIGGGAGDKMSGDVPFNWIANRVLQTELQIFPHVASDNQWHTDVFVLNANDFPVTFSFLPYTDTGAALPLDGNPPTTNLTLAPNGSTFFRTSPASTANEGWAALTTSAPLLGVAVYGRRGSDGSYYEASTPLTYAYGQFRVPFDETQSPLGVPFENGFAVANTDPSQSATITCTAYASDGSVLASRLQIGPLNPLQHKAFLIDQQFGPSLAGQRGTLVCQSSTLVGAVELRAFSTFSSVSTMPVIPNAAITKLPTPPQ